MALGVVLAVALLVGSGVFTHPPPAAAARIASLEQIVRCPGCIDLSVAQSNAPSSIAVRHEIAADVHEGRSNSQILASLAATYGTSVLLLPPSDGLGTALWLAPICVAVVVAALIAVGLRRRRASA